MLLRYAAFQVPGTVVVAGLAWAGHRYFGLAAWIAAAAVALWVVKDAVMFPFVRRAYEPDGAGGGVNDLVGARGTAEDDLAPAG